MDPLDQFKQTFFAECGELLADMEERLAALSPDTQDAEQLNAIFRAAHSIKGGAGAFGLEPIMRFTHTLEATLDELREERLALTQPLIQLMLKAGDTVSKMLECAQGGQPIAEGFGAEVQQQLQALSGAGVLAPLQKKSTDTAAFGEMRYKIGFAPGADFFANGSEPLMALRALQLLGPLEVTVDTAQLPAFTELEPTACYCSWALALTTGQGEQAIWDCFEFAADRAAITIAAIDTLEPVAIPKTKAAADETQAAQGAQAVRSIRVDTDKIDRLADTVGELVIAEAGIAARLPGLPAQAAAILQRELDALSLYTRELQDAVMAIRMQPVKSVFARMSRLVRDTAAQLGKEINLVLQGEATEVDKTVIEQLADPLTHMIRNSIDHGIETPDQRVWNDKPQAGTITLSASQRSGKILIEIVDDGAGIRRDRVLAKAREKGLVAPTAELSEHETDNLIFLPGFSTAETVTSVSGRGVGMDVVRRNIEAMGGTVSVASREGEGSRFTISLPLTLAILDGMVVRIGEETYIVPITSIIETLRLESAAVQTLEGQGEVAIIRGEVVPVIRLGEIWDIACDEGEDQRLLTVIVESAQGKLAIAIDELVGQQQVVVKSFEANAGRIPGIASATILGDGRVALILEINELQGLSSRQHRQLAA